MAASRAINESGPDRTRSLTAAEQVVTKVSAAGTLQKIIDSLPSAAAAPSGSVADRVTLPASSVRPEPMHSDAVIELLRVPPAAEKQISVLREIAAEQQAGREALELLCEFMRSETELNEMRWKASEARERRRDVFTYVATGAAVVAAIAAVLALAI